jgi:drug/metabolite transporter (DMT)-like permease
MSSTALALISASVVLHVLWNTVAKGRPTFAFFFMGNLFGSIVMLPIIFVHASSLSALPSEIWLILAGAGVAQTVYGLGLARAYREENLSVVYPLVRSLGPAFVVLGSFALGRGDAIGLACVVGVAAIFFGSVALGMSNLYALGRRTLPGAGIRFSVLAALGTAGYTLIDDVGVHRVLASDALASLGDTTVRAGLLYAAFEGWASSIAMGLWLLRKAEHRQAIREYTSPAALRDAAVMGVGSYASYALVLIAMLYASDVSYVAGFRQLSVPIGAAVGIFWLGERLNAGRAAGLLAMLIGLLLIAFV